MGGDMVLWRRLIIGAISVGFLALVGVGIALFLLPRLEFATEEPPLPVLTEAEQRQRALEEYQEIQANATTTPSSSTVDAAVKAASPKGGPSEEERRSALETYLQTQSN